MRSLTLGLAQLNSKLGDVRANLDQHLAYIDEAAKQGVDLLVFPELSLCGYALQDLVPTVAHRPTPDDVIFAPLLAASQARGIDVMIGFVHEDQRNRFFIAAAYLSQGKVVHVHHKVYLPTYGLFDEGRFFAWGDSIRAFDTRFGRVGMLICEDFWHASPPYVLWLDGADVLLFHSVSPARGLDHHEQPASMRWVEHVVQAYANLFTAFTVNVTRVGFEDGLMYGGGSVVFDPDGNSLARGPFLEEGITVAQLDLNQLHRTRARLPLLRDERHALVAREIARITAGNAGARDKG